MPRRIGEHPNVTIELHRQYVTGCSVCDEKGLVWRIRDHGEWIGDDVDLLEEVWLRYFGRKGQEVGHDSWRTMNRYGHLFPSDMDALAADLDAVRSRALADHRSSNSVRGKRNPFHYR